MVEVGAEREDLTMVPTFLGRIQTRMFVLLTVGVVATIIITPFVPMDRAPGVSWWDALPGSYAITFAALGFVLLAGIVIWEPLYHLLQQFRWEKDWPAMFGFLTGINEGILAYFLLTQWGPKPADVAIPTIGFAIDFAFVWMSTFLFVNGPMRVVSLRWRFRGGRLV
jgi:hypothetical protein